MKTIVIGLGNPIMTDDGVGIKIARELKDRLSSSNGSNGLNCSIDIVEAYAGGLRLMDELAGYDRAVIIDAMVTGRVSPGAVQMLPLSALISTRNMTCMHDTNIPTALELGSMLGLKLPEEITVFGIETKDVETFGEELTEDVEKAVPFVVDDVIRHLTRI
jgi:hydrogenase maturation protease